MISENLIFWCSVIYIASTRICTIYLEYLNREWLSDNTVHIFQVLHLRAWLECQKKQKHLTACKNLKRESAKLI